MTPKAQIYDQKMVISVLKIKPNSLLQNIFLMLQALSLPINKAFLFADYVSKDKRAVNFCSWQMDPTTVIMRIALSETRSRRK